MEEWDDGYITWLWSLGNGTPDWSSAPWICYLNGDRLFLAMSVN